MEVRRDEAQGVTAAGFLKKAHGSAGSHDQDAIVRVGCAVPEVLHPGAPAQEGPASPPCSVASRGWVGASAKTPFWCGKLELSKATSPQPEGHFHGEA